MKLGYSKRNFLGKKQVVKIAAILVIVIIVIAVILFFSAKPNTKTTSTSNETQNPLTSLSNNILGGLIPSSNTQNSNTNETCLEGNEKCSGATLLLCENSVWLTKDDINHTCGKMTRCTAGKTRCVGQNYYVCENSIWTNKGKVNGQCAYSAPQTSQIIQTEQTNQANNNEISFVKEGYGNQKDCITDKVCITRGDTQGIYNSAQEQSFADDSPKDTEWFFGKNCETKLSFKPWINATNHNPQQSIDKLGCLHLITENQYYNIKFTSFVGGGKGGGFSYIRSREPVTISNTGSGN